MTSPAYARRIAESIPAGPGEHLLEIGPGKGALSIFLKERFPDMHLVEVDEEAIPFLREKLGTGAFTIHAADALAFDFGKAGSPLHVAGNLPYSIAAFIIKKTLLSAGIVRSCTFMVQREVAERIVSAPHRKSYGFLSIFCQFFGDPAILFHVPPGAFFPKPNVESAVFRMMIDGRAEVRLPRDRWNDFFAFVTSAFTRRRKQLPNALGRTAEEKKRLDEIATSIGISAASRPEDLGVTEWVALYKRWLS